MKANTSKVFDIARWLALDGKLKDNQSLPVWQTIYGLVGSGDYPRAYNRRSDASNACARQARCESDGLLGFVVERKGNLLSLHQLGRWERTIDKRKSGHWVDRPDDILRDYIAPPQVVEANMDILSARGRRSLLASRA